MLTPQDQLGEIVVPTPVSDNTPPPATSPEAAADDRTDLMAAAFAIFERGENSFELASGKTVELYAAKMKHLASTMRFVSSVVNELETSQLADLIDLIGKKQKALLAEGKDPRKVDLKEVVTDDMVTGAFENASIISTLFAAAFEHLPGFVSLYTNLTPAEFDELDFDEGVMTAAGIFILNYAFFTQRLRPLLMGFIRALASESQKNGAAGVKKNLTKMSRTK